MKLKELQLYEESERETARLYGPAAVSNGFIADGPLIYTDKLVSSRLAFHRQGAPLKALLLLYEQTVVYIPPADKSELEQRFGISWSDLLKLSERECIIPVIGHPTHYSDKVHFDSMLKLKPASVWARGDEIAHRFADGAEYWSIAKRIVPYADMSQTDWLQKRFQRHFPSLSSDSRLDRIQTELLTNFVDLCIHGYEPLATELVTLPDPGYAAKRLLEVSEILTYPSLMGLGGTPNYGLNSEIAVAEARGAEYLHRGRELGPEAELLLRGLSIGFPRLMSPELIMQFHRDGMSTWLWQALAKLEHQVALKTESHSTELTDAATHAQEILAEALREVRGAGYSSLRSRSHDLARSTVGLTIKLGESSALATAAWGPLGHDWMNLALAGVQFSSVLLAAKKFESATNLAERRIADLIANRKTSPLASQLWWLSQWREKGTR